MLSEEVDSRRHIVIVGGGFTGLAAAWELTKANCRVTVLEADSRVGGLAGGFVVNGATLEKFYHHWFTNDIAVTSLVEELGLERNLIEHQSRTGMYYAKSIFKMSKPLDLLAFKPLPFIDRIRLGMLVVRARMVRDWRALENISAHDWLVRLCGDTVYRVVWEPLLKGKFGIFAEEISAVWLWNKLRLRGGSRDRRGNEVLLYYKGGFAALAEALAARIRSAGGTVSIDSRVTSLGTDGNRVSHVVTSRWTIACDDLLLTTPLPITADLLAPHLGASELAALRRVQYLANICLVLRLDRSLTGMYWINVNDPSFPFVGIIEHTNFESPESYGGDHIVYLSRYLPAADPAYSMSDTEYLQYAIPHVRRMFPEFQASWIRDAHVWRAEFTQPIVERQYSSLIPDMKTSMENAYICTMAQIYPEDRGTNYAIKSGRKAAQLMLGTGEGES